MNVAVMKKEFYKQKDGQEIIKVICKPTAKYPEGRNYFYCDSEDEDIVDLYNWGLDVSSKQTVVAVRPTLEGGYRPHLLFHRELAYKYLKHYPACIDHINGIDIDNTDINLNVLSNRQNTFNAPTRGYSLNKGYKTFQARVGLYGSDIKMFSVTHSEVEACEQAYYTESNFLKLKLGDDYYMYDFLKDRRHALDLLELERTGQITAEEATYRHVLRYAGNAWYFYRYALQEYFKDNNIPIPTYDLDENGFMIHSVTGQKLCPY